MIDKKRGYRDNYAFYDVDDSVSIQAGMVAFLANNASGVTVATTAASGTVPLGTFWKDAANAFVRSAVESHSFSSGGTINLNNANVTATTAIKVTNSAGTTTYTQGTDYTVAIANGVVTRVGGGTIAAGATVVIWYRYTAASGQEHWDRSSTKWSTGLNFDNLADDTTGSGKITVIEGDCAIYTDQYDPAVAYTLNGLVYSNAASLWSSTAGATSACGRVIKVPTAADPFLGVHQIRVIV